MCLFIKSILSLVSFVFGAILFCAADISKARFWISWLLSLKRIIYMASSWFEEVAFWYILVSLAIYNLLRFCDVARCVPTSHLVVLDFPVLVSMFSWNLIRMKVNWLISCNSSKYLIWQEYLPLFVLIMASHHQTLEGSFDFENFNFLENTSWNQVCYRVEDVWNQWDAI